MKPILVILFFLKLTFSLAQGIVYGDDELWADPNLIRETYDHGFIVTYDFKPPYKPDANSALLKVDINANLLWEKKINNQDEYLQIKGITTTKDNGILVTGRTCLMEEVNSDAFVMKLDPCMEVEWCNIYRTPELDDFMDEVVHIPSENSYIISSFSAYQPVNERASLIKLDSTGALVWKKSAMFNPYYIGELISGLEYDTTNSSVVINGFVDAPVDTTGLYSIQPYLCKFSINGTFDWELFQIPDTSFTRGLTARRTMFSSSGIFVPIVGSHKARMLRLNSEGQFISLSTLHQPPITYGITPYSSCMLNNHLYFGLQHFITNQYADGNGYIQKTDTLGNFISEVMIPNDFTAIVYDICKTFDDKLLAAVSHDINEMDFMLLKYKENLEYDSIYTVPLIYDSHCPEGITSGTIDLSCNIITGTTDIFQTSQPTLNLAPNPANDYTIIYLPEMFSTSEKHNIISVTTAVSDYVKDLTITVYDVNSTLIYAATLPDGVKAQVLKTTGWKSGIYFIRISKANQTIATGKLIVE